MTLFSVPLAATPAEPPAGPAIARAVEPPASLADLFAFLGEEAAVGEDLEEAVLTAEFDQATGGERRPAEVKQDDEAKP